MFSAQECCFLKCRECLWSWLCSSQSHVLLWFVLVLSVMSSFSGGRHQQVVCIPWGPSPVVLWCKPRLCWRMKSSEEQIAGSSEKKRSFQKRYSMRYRILAGTQLALSSEGEGVLVLRCTVQPTLSWQTDCLASHIRDKTQLTAELISSAGARRCRNPSWSGVSLCNWIHCGVSL